MCLLALEGWRQRVVEETRGTGSSSAHKEVVHGVLQRLLAVLEARRGSRGKHHGHGGVPEGNKGSVSGGRRASHGRTLLPNRTLHPLQAPSASTSSSPEL